MQAGTYLQLLISLFKANSVISRRFAVQGLGLTDIVVLYQLHLVPEGKMRPVDLAEKLGLTASGVTRMLLPMEKIGLIKRTAEKNDARINYANLAPGGKRMLEEVMERAELLSEELCNAVKLELKQISDLSQKLV